MRARLSETDLVATERASPPGRPGLHAVALVLIAGVPTFAASQPAAPAYQPPPEPPAVEDLEWSPDDRW
jgi:hypothetical protein